MNTRVLVSEARGAHVNVCECRCTKEREESEECVLFRVITASRHCHRWGLIFHLIAIDSTLTTLSWIFASAAAASAHMLMTLVFCAL